MQQYLFILLIKKKVSSVLQGWIKELEDKNTNDVKADDEQIMLKILVGNKLDLDNEREVKYENGEKFSKDNKFSLLT